MKMEFTEEGGYAEFTSGTDAETELEVIRDHGKIRFSVTSRNKTGEMGLGVGLDAAEARELGELLIAYATILTHDTDDG